MTTTHAGCHRVSEVTDATAKLRSVRVQGCISRHHTSKDTGPETRDRLKREVASIFPPMQACLGGQDAD